MSARNAAMSRRLALATAALCPIFVPYAVQGAVLRSARLHTGSSAHLDLDLSIRGDVPELDAPSSLVASNASTAGEAADLAAIGKPIRIARGGAKVPKKSDAGKVTHPSSLHCGVTSKVNSGSDKYERCPEQCPFFAQDRTDDDFCTFTCVTEPQCKEKHPATQIGDEELGVCRSCIVDGCLECDISTTEDKCAKCQAGYLLQDNGHCRFKYAGPWMTYVGYGLGVILLLVLLWVVDMAIRPCCNEKGLNDGLAARERMKIRMKKDENGERNLFPLTTNLMKTQVAGPGMMLHFNFQTALIVWAVFIAATWMCFAQFVDDDLWRLGTRKFGTPRENCILVAWGYETQNALMWTKVGFLWIAYIGTVLFCLGYGIFQLREFQEADYQHKTMKDFVAMAMGLQNCTGDQPVEQQLKSRIEAMSGQPVVGVSVAWNYQEYAEEIDKALEEDMEAMDPNPEPGAEPDMNPIRKQLFSMEQKALGLSAEAQADGMNSDVEGEQDRVEIILTRLHSSPRAFVVFPNQEAMEEAVEKAADGFEFNGSQITLETLDAEPNTVQWVNFGHSTPREKSLKLLAGFGVILLACLFWAVVFYAPYAYYVMTFNYENGREPGFIVGFAFSMIVVVGNAIMYEVCAQLSDWVGFMFKDNREACYMILYTVACMFNVLLDFVTTYKTAEMVMEGLGFRNYFGVPLSEITEFTAKFETYGMQRSLAENTYGYAFPSTYLIPFLIEPLPTIIGPLAVGRLIVRSHPEVQGRNAEGWLGMADMEMGRYADLLLNVILGVLIFYFPGGYTWMLFLGMAGSHVWIYAFDHYRVLRSIPSCTFASFDIEWWAQAMWAPITGMIAACLAFKSNCEPGLYCVKGFPIIVVCSFAWLVHVIAHLAMLKFVIPMFGKAPPEVDPAADETFESLSHQVPCSWFTSNPVHCLRSKHHYKHSPACSFFKLGQEHVMKENKAIGCFFEEKEKQTA